MLKAYKNVILKKNGRNLGIAVALNRIVLFAKTYGAQWVFTLDQDSVVESNLISEYSKYVNIPNVGMLSCIIKDRNTKKITALSQPYVEIESCITSGSYLKIDAWETTGGFDEKMFIDYVDFDMCQMLLENNYKIIRINYQGLLHEVGHSHMAKFMGKEEVIFNHSAFRKYYIVRNRFYYVRKHKYYIDKKREYLRIFKYILLVLLFEDDKFNKGKQMIKGIFDGIHMK